MDLHIHAKINANNYLLNSENLNICSLRSNITVIHLPLTFKPSASQCSVSSTSIQNQLGRQLPITRQGVTSQTTVLILNCSILLHCVDMTWCSSFCHLCALLVSIHLSSSLYCISLHVSAQSAIIRCTGCCDEGICCSMLCCFVFLMTNSRLCGLTGCCHAFALWFCWFIFGSVCVCPECFCLAVSHHGHLWSNRCCT
jgi:hypothetical protein